MWFEPSQAAHCIFTQSFCLTFSNNQFARGLGFSAFFSPPEYELLRAATMMMINLRENYNLLVQNNIRRHNLGNIFPLLKNNCSDIFFGRFFSLKRLVQPFDPSECLYFEIWLCFPLVMCTSCNVLLRRFENFLCFSTADWRNWFSIRLEEPPDSFEILDANITNSSLLDPDFY